MTPAAVPSTRSPLAPLAASLALALSPWGCGAPRGGTGEAEAAGEPGERPVEGGGAGEAVDAGRLRAVLGTANRLVAPAVGREVSYDTSTRTVSIRFTTPPSTEIDFENFWWRWRRNQFVVLRAFDEAGVAVDSVVVETNHTDGSGRVRVRTPAGAVRSAAALADDAAWRSRSQFHQQRTGSAQWELVTP